MFTVVKRSCFASRFVDFRKWAKIITFYETYQD